MQTQIDRSVAVKILRQLGGNKFIAVTGAKNSTSTFNSLAFRLPSNMTKNRINIVTISSNGMDTYDIRMMSMRGNKVSIIHDISGIYNDGAIRIYYR